MYEYEVNEKQEEEEEEKQHKDMCAHSNQRFVLQYGLEAPHMANVVHIYVHIITYSNLHSTS